MTAPRQADLRKNQKDRTRAAIVEAAIAVLKTGVTPTVIGAAEAAKVSRATAYRYFPTQEALLTEIMGITPSLEPVEDALRRMTGDDPHQRLNTLLDVFNTIVIENESEYRAALRLYLETWFESKKTDPGVTPTVRAGRRRRFLEEALAPLRVQLSAAAWRRLTSALSLTLSIDSIVIMKDACGLQDKEALAVLKWTAGVVLDAAINEAAAKR